MNLMSKLSLFLVNHLSHDSLGLPVLAPTSISRWRLSISFKGSLPEIPLSDAF